MNDEVLLEKIDNLTTKVDEGFRETNNHLKTLNGQIVKHANLISNLEKEDIRVGAEIEAGKEQRKTGRGTWIIISALISVVLTLLGIYVW